MSFVTEVEGVVDELADWVVETILMIIDNIMPDGKPFFKELPSEEDQLKQYYTIRGNQEEWVKWIGQQASDIILELQDSAVPPDMILSVHPLDIAQKAAIQWSADMEDLIRKGTNAVSVE